MCLIFFFSALSHISIEHRNNSDVAALVIQSYLYIHNRTMWYVECANEWMNMIRLWACVPERKTQTMGGEQRGVNGNNRQFFFFFFSFFHSLGFFFVMFTNSYIHTYTLSLLGQTTIEIDDDHKLSGHLFIYIKKLLIISIK
jgi:hypothetical protein